MATNLDPVPPLPSASVPLTDAAWRDYQTKLNQWLQKHAAATQALLTGAAAASAAWATASGQSSASSSSTSSSGS